MLRARARLSGSKFESPVRPDGPFRVCSHLNSESDSCKAVDGHCEFSLRPVSGVEIKVPVVKDCDKWNAARELLVIAAITAIIAFMLLGVSFFLPSFRNFRAILYTQRLQS